VHNLSFEHPSDHNSIIVQGIERLEWTRTQRTERFKAKLEKKAKISGEAVHERAFGRTIRSIDPNEKRWWDLAAPFDARVMDGNVPHNRYQVDGIEPPASLNTLFKPGAFGNFGVSRAATSAAIVPTTGGAW